MEPLLQIQEHWALTHLPENIRQAGWKMHICTKLCVFVCVLTHSSWDRSSTSSTSIARLVPGITIWREIRNKGTRVKTKSHATLHFKHPSGEDHKLQSALSLPSRHICLLVLVWLSWICYLKSEWAVARALFNLRCVSALPWCEWSTPLITFPQLVTNPLAAAEQCDSWYTAIS